MWPAPSLPQPRPAPSRPRLHLAAVAGCVALKAKGLGAMSELLLTLRRAPERREEMLRKERKSRCGRRSD